MKLKEDSAATREQSPPSSSPTPVAAAPVEPVQAESSVHIFGADPVKEPPIDDSPLSLESEPVNEVVEPESLSFTPPQQTGPTEVKPESEPVPVTMPEQQADQFSLFHYNRIALLVTAAAVTIVLLIGAVSLFWGKHGNGSNLGKGGSGYTVGSNLDLDAVRGNRQLQVGQANQLTVNGLLQVSNTLVLAPTDRPVSPTRGQIYYDRTANTLYYYDGTQFVSLNQSHVSSVGGVEGIIGLGAGLTMVGNQLSVSSAVLRQGAAGSGVSSLQGQTGDVTLAAGPGIGVSGTTISNQGVISLAAGSANLTVTSDGSGHYTVSAASGVSGITGSGTAGHIPKFNGTTDVTDSGLTESGTTLSYAGNLVVDAANGFVGNLINLAVNGSSKLTVTQDGSTVQGGTLTVNGTGASSIAGSLSVGTGLSVTTGGISVTGNSTIAGTLSSLTGLTSSGTITFSSLNSSGVVHTNGSGVLSTGPVALGVDTSGDYVANLGSLTGLSTTGNSGAGSTPTLSVDYGGGSNQAVQGNTILNCASGTGNLSGGGNAITLGNGGSCNNISITNSPVFSGTLAVQGAGGITVGVANTTTGVLNLANSGNSNLGTLQIAALGQATVYTLPDPGQVSADICLSTGNCAGSGGGIIGSGTSGKIAKFTGGNTIADSTLSESGSTLTASGNVVIQGANSLSLGTASTNTGALTFYSAVTGNTFTLQAGATGGNLTFTLPTADGGNGNCLKTNGSGTLTFASCTGGAGGGVTSVNSLTGVLTLNNATTSGGDTITIDDASTTQKGIAQFNSTNFSASSGTINTIQDIASSSSPTFNGLTLSNALTVANGGTGTGSFTLNGILYGNGTSAIQATTAAADSILATNGSNVPGLTQTLPVAVQSNISTVGTLTSGSIGSGFSTISTGNLISTTSSLHGNTLSVGSSNQFQVDASGNATTTGTLAVQGAGGLTLGVANSVAGVLNLANGTNTNLAALQAAAPSGVGTATYNLPSIVGGNSDTVCLLTLANCVGAGGSIAGTGTATHIAKFTAANTIADSGLTESGTTLTYAGNLVVNAANGFSGNLINLEVNSSSKLSVDQAGNSTQAGTLTVNGTGASSVAGTLSVGTLGSGGTTALCSNSGVIGTCASTGSIGYWNRTGTTLQPANSGDDITTSGNISTTGSGSITAAGGLTVQGFGASIQTAASNALQVLDGSSENVFNVNSSGRNILVGSFTPSVNTALTVVGDSIFRSAVDSPTAFLIQNSGTGNLFVADTTNSRVGVNTGSLGLNTNFNVYNGGESITQTQFTQNLTNAGINVITDYVQDAYTAGLFWSTQDNNPTSPKAGIYTQLTNNGSKLLFGTSSSYSAGLTNTALTIGYNGDSVFRNGFNTPTGFQVQNANGIGLFTIDTTTGAALTSTLFVDTLGTGGTTAVCWNGSLQISSCASTGSIGYWNRTGTTLQPATSGDNILTTSNVTTPLLTSSAALAVTGGTTLTLQSTTTNAVSLDSGTTGAINIGTNANAKTITIGNSTGATSLVLNAGTGAINIGTNAIAHTTTIGNNTGASSVVINCGTGSCNFGTTATAHATSIGSTTGASATTLQGGTGGLNITTQGTGALAIGNNAVAQTINIGNATGATTVSVLCGTGTCGFGNNATAHSTTIGSQTGVSATTIQAGTSGITLSPAGSGSNNGVLIKPASDTTAAFQIQKAASAVNALEVDTTNMTTTLTAGTDAAVLSSEIFTSGTSFTSGSGWTSNGLTGQSASITHTSGTTAKGPTPALSLSSGQDYVITWDITNPNSGGTLNITMGGQTLATYSFDDNDSGTYTLSDSAFVTTSSTANLSFTPNGAFTGKIDNISVKRITAYAQPALVINNTSGAPSLQVTASHTSNMFVGWSTGQANVTGTGNVGIGPNSLQSNISGENNTALGWAALTSNITGDSNVAVGQFALVSNTSGSNNVALGLGALRDNLQGGGNVAIGYNALESNIDGFDNVAIGYNTLGSATTAAYNLGIGSFNLQDVTTASSNIAIGYSSLRDTTDGYNNNSIGVFSLEHNTTGADNVALGTEALQNNDDGSQNVAIGNYALIGNTSGFANIAIGAQALQGNDTGSFNTAIGREAGVLFGGLDNATVLGAEAEVGSSNTIILGYSEGRGIFNNVGIGTSFAQNPFEVAPNTYNSGTISQSGGSGTVVGSGTTFTAQMVGATIFYPDGTTGVITGFTNSTHVTSSNTTGGWPGGTEYAIVWGGFNVNSDASVYLQNTSDTSEAFSVVNVAGTNLFNVNTQDAYLNVKGTGANGGGSRLTFGDFAPVSNLTVFVGEEGTTDTDILQLNGAGGVHITSGSFSSPETVGAFSYDSGRDSGVLSLGETTAGGYLEFDNNGAFKWSIGMDSADACGAGTPADTLYIYSNIAGGCAMQLASGGEAAFMSQNSTDAFAILNEDGDNVITVDTTGTADTFLINQRDNGGGNLFHVQRDSDDAVIVDSGGHATFRTLTSNDGADAFRLQNSASNTTYLTTNSSNYTITVQGTTTTFANLTLTNAHFKSTQTTAPTIGTPTSCGTTPTAAIGGSSTDSAGSFRITAGTGSPTTCNTTISFNKNYGAAPKSIIVVAETKDGGTGTAAARQIYVSGSAVGTFTVKFNSNPAASEVNWFYYWVIE